MIDLSRFEAELNESQLEAVTYCDGPSLVVAGAGSGKTRVLTYKIAYLLLQGLEPWSILALTFTNKAAREMNERIAGICGDASTRYLWSGTFHSIFARILRMEHEAINYPEDFTIYDASDSRSLIKNIVKELGLDDKIYKPAAVGCKISEAKNHLLQASDYAADGSIIKRDAMENMKETAKIYGIYQARLRAASAMDFDDLLLNTFLLFRNNQEVLRKYSERFKYILVDEYQDTNMVQHRILSQLTQTNSRICVVGDDAQSIYGFRGADITNILQFQKQYPTARLIKLECNYRSTRNIVEAANSIIRHNIHQIPKKVYSAGNDGEQLHQFSANSDREEAQKVVMRIIKLHNKGLNYSDIALLYRTNAQSRSFEEAFKNSGIPYRIYGGLSFYQRKEIKDVLAYMRLVCNPNDEEAFRRVINYPTRGIGLTTLNKIQYAAAHCEASLWQVACDPAAYGVQLNKGATNKLSAFCNLIRTFRIQMETVSAHDLTACIIRDSGIGRDITSDNSAENISRRENIDELLGSIKSHEKDVLEEEGRTFVSLSDFLSTVSLLTDADEKSDNAPHVTLMTVHAAKGLEFEAVFVTGMEHDLFPTAGAALIPKDMEEERRLFYVAVTRAKQYCYLSYAATRYRYGSMQFNEPSSFLDEIDEQYIDREDEKSGTNLWGNSRETFNRAAPFESNRSGFNPWSNNYNSREQRDTMRDDELRDNFSPRRTYYRTNHDEKPQRHTPIMPPPGFKRASITPSTPQQHTEQTASPSYSIGTRIRHERFGLGTIIGVEGAGDSEKILVNFEQSGTKNLLVKYARFTICQ